MSVHQDIGWMSHFQDIQASVHAFHTFGRQTCTVPAALAEAIIVPSGDLAFR